MSRMNTRGVSRVINLCRDYPREFTFSEHSEFVISIRNISSRLLHNEPKRKSMQEKWKYLRFETGTGRRYRKKAKVVKGILYNFIDRRR